MNIPLKEKIENLLQDIDSLKTPACVDINTIGLYAENKLSNKEEQKAENHLQSCLYCLKQLNDMKEMLYFQEQKTSISPELIKKLSGLCLKQEETIRKTGFLTLFVGKIKDFLAFPFRQWRYSVVGLASACMTSLFILFFLRTETHNVLVPHIDSNSFVNIRALSDSGKVLNEAQGVVINSKGLVASNLYQLAGASSIQVTLRDGRTYQTRNIWKDEDKNLAVMKINNESLPSIPIADIKQVNIGQSVFVVTDPTMAKKGFKESLVSDFKQMPGRRKESTVQYIQLATFTTNTTKGALIDGQGKLVGLLITEEKNINLAVPIADAERIVKEGKAIPVSELKRNKFSADALNFYMKGILARDAQRWNEAMEFYKKALKLNPNLVGAHIELGYVYYIKHLYDLEAREYEDVLKIDPQNKDALYSLGTNLETRGLFKEAINKYEEVIALDPEDAETIFELGLAYLALGQKDKAMTLYPKLKAIDPGYGEVLRRLGK